MNQYSPSEFLKNMYFLFMTKLTFPQARLIRRPVYFRGRKSLSGCRGLTCGYSCRFDLPGDKKTLFIGDNCEMGDMTHIAAHERVEIGDNVLIASKCFISDTNHGSYSGDDASTPESAPKQRALSHRPVRIGNNVWIGENVVILAGSSIGDGCVIGANAVVSGHFESATIIGGVPAKVLKKYDDQLKRWERV